MWTIKTNHGWEMKIEQMSNLHTQWEVKRAVGHRHGSKRNISNSEVIVRGIMKTIWHIWGPTARYLSTNPICKYTTTVSCWSCRQLVSMIFIDGRGLSSLSRKTKRGGGKYCLQWINEPLFHPPNNDPQPTQECMETEQR